MGVDFPGNTAYPASSGDAVVTIQYTPVLSWAAPADITYPTPLSGTQLDATADVPGSFVYTPPAGTVLNAGVGQVLSAMFTPADPVDYGSASGAVVTVNINVSKYTPVLSWANPADITCPAPLSGTQLDATANVPGSFAYTPPEGTVLNPGHAQTLSATFTPNGHHRLRERCIGDHDYQCQSGSRSNERHVGPRNRDAALRDDDTSGRGNYHHGFGHKSIGLQRGLRGDGLDECVRVLQPGCKPWKHMSLEER